MNVQTRRACLTWAIATAVFAAGVVAAYLADAGIAAGWTCVGIAVGLAISRIWTRSGDRSDP